MDVPLTERPAARLRRAARRAAVGALSAGATLLCLWAAAPQAAAKDLDAVCQQTGEDKRRLECDVRFFVPREIGTATARVVESNRPLPKPTVERYPRRDDRSAVLLLFDLSDPARAATVAANAQDARYILDMARPHDQFGIAALPGTTPGPASDLLVQIGADRLNLDRRLAEMRARGPSSPIYLSAIEGIRKLAETDARRRALVLFSDGKAEDRGYTLENVIDEALARHVVIFTFGVAERSAETPFLQPLRRMAEETGGRHYQADIASHRFAPPDLQAVLAQLDSGGRVTVELPEVVSEQTVELSFVSAGIGPTLVHREPVRDLAPTPSPPPPQPSWYSRLASWVREHQVESILAGIAAFLLLLALVVWGVHAGRRRRREREAVLPGKQVTSSFPSTEMPPERMRQGGGTPIATLQPLLNGGAAHLVTNTMVTIGRARDCDIRLSDETVSAHHATLVRKRDGFFELTDMNSRNGVRVNGELVNHRRLSPGDRIRFGAAPELRFVPGQAGRAAE